VNVVDVFLSLGFRHGNTEVIKVKGQNFCQIIKARKLNRFLHFVHYLNLMKKFEVVIGNSRKDDNKKKARCKKHRAQMNEIR
jgi:hypothetical protein